MTSFESEGSSSPLDDRIALSGFEIETPPRPKDRLFVVKNNVEAFRADLGNAARSVNEIARTCLSAEDEQILQPEIGSQTLFSLRHDLSVLALECTFGSLNRTNGVPLYKAAELLPRITPSDKRLEIALAIANHEFASDQATHVVVSMVPEALQHGAIDNLSSRSDPKATARFENRNREKAALPSQLMKRVHSLRSFGNPGYMRQSPLHDKAHQSEVVKFRKSGAETYILPKELEASVRVIPTHSASAWLKAFENWPEWYRRGFNYVPIEPIQSIDPTDKNHLVAVTTTNLRGKSLLSVASFIPKEHLEKLYEMREEIRSGISDLHIQHRHMHDENFVVVPYLNENENEKPDLSRCPRLYAIDFDEADIAT